MRLINKNDFQYNIVLKITFDKMTSVVLVDRKLDYLHFSLIEFLEDNTPSKWSDFFGKSDLQLTLNEISDSLVMETRETGSVVYPPLNNIFRAFYMISPPEINVCILGMDPYHNGVATGLAFSVPKGCRLPPSLVNIRKEIANCGYVNTPNVGDLSCWVNQGVFLINSSLTVVESSAGSHIAMWSKFTASLLKYITRNQVIIFLMLGKKAQAYQKYLPHNQIIIATSHPSHLSANEGFLGSKCFKQVNDALIKLEKEKIDWTL